MMPGSQGGIQVDTRTPSAASINFDVPSGFYDAFISEFTFNPSPTLTLAARPATTSISQLPLVASTSSDSTPKPTSIMSPKSQSNQLPHIGVVLGSVLGGLVGILFVTVVAFLVRKVYKKRMDRTAPATYINYKLQEGSKKYRGIEDETIVRFLRTGYVDARMRELGLKKLERALERKWTRERNALVGANTFELEAFAKRKETERRLLLAASLETLSSGPGDRNDVYINPRS